MLVSKTHKIELAASKDQTRAALLNPYLERGADGDKVIATDGRMLAVLPVECDEKDVTGYIPRECLKDARKAGGVILNGVAEVYCGASYPRGTEYNFPQWRQVMPDYSRRRTVKLGIDPALLKRLADAIGAEIVCLEFPVDGPGEWQSGDRITDPLIVKPSARSGGENPAHGVLMPCRVG
jgi:hypothetical protein